MSHAEFILNPEGITVLSAVATALSTIAIAVLTYYVVQENRALRKAGSSPELVAYLSPNPDGNGSVEFILANVGRGPAFDVAFNFINDDEDFRAHDVMVVNDKSRKPFSVIPQDEKQRAFFGIGHVLFGSTGETPIDPLKSFVVQIRYRDSEGRTYKHKRELDIHQFAGLYGLVNASGGHQIAKVLESIDRRLAEISRVASKQSKFVSVAQLRDGVIQKKKGNPPQ